MPSSNRKRHGDFTSPNGDGQVPEKPYARFAQRLQESADNKDLKSANLADKLGITRGTMARYWDGERLPPSDTLITLSETLGVSPAWLIRGGDKSGGVLASASDADWVRVEEFDLRQMTDSEKGEAIGSTLFRRDWLYLTLGDSSGLWIARLLSHEMGMPAGAPIFCKDHPQGEMPQEGRVYIFRVNGGTVIGRFTYRQTGLRMSLAEGRGYPVPFGSGMVDHVITPADLEDRDFPHFIVARVVGVLARPL